MKKLEQWYECISGYRKLKINEAQALLVKARENNDRDCLNQVIVGTLYVVYNHIKTNGFELVHDSLYDIDDVINAFNEQWINEILRYRLLEVDTFARIFDRCFYMRALASMGVNKYPVKREVGISPEILVKAFMEYFDLIISGETVDFIQFKSIVEKYNVLSEVKYEDINYPKLYELFKSIYEVMEFDKLDDSFSISERRFDFFKYLFINSAIINKIDNSLSYDDEDERLQNLCYDRVMEIIESSRLNENEKKVLYLRFGFFGECQTLKGASEILGKSSGRISFLEGKALRKLRSLNIRKELYGLGE